MDFQKIFLARLLEAKGDVGVTEFARRCGLLQPLMSMYFKGIRTPGAEHLYKICRACGVSSDYLLGLSDIPMVDSQKHSPDIAAEPKTFYKGDTV